MPPSTCSRWRAAWIRKLLGENEIFGQVKEAYAAAQHRGSTGAVLNRVFQKAFQAAKHVRTHTAISSGQVSIASVAVDLAANIFGSLAGTRVLVLGTGDIGEATARAFRSRGAADLAVGGTARRARRRGGLRAQRVGRSVRRPGGTGGGVRHRRLLDVGPVGGARRVLGLRRDEEAPRAPPSSSSTWRCPRDVEAPAGSLENVFLYNLDDLAKIAEQNRAARVGEIERCRTLLSERADGLWRHVQPYLESPGPSGPKPHPARSGKRRGAGGGPRIGS